MKVEYTARQVKLTKSMQNHADEALERIGRILGKTARAEVTLFVERREHVAEIRLKLRQQTLVATGRDEAPMGALRKALVHIEQQARKNHERQRDKKRLPKEETAMVTPPVSRQKTRPSFEITDDTLLLESHNGYVQEATKPRKRKIKAEIPVHSFPQRKKTVEPHILHASDAISLRPMSIEQAVKEAEFQDRDLLIFRTPDNQQYVLHRRRNGQMELVEMP
jgi:putative sigma-54 modulation protein